jgi:hypothetical protein
MQPKVAACGLAFDAEYRKTKNTPDSPKCAARFQTGLFHMRADAIRPIGQGKNIEESVHHSVRERSHADPTYYPTHLQASLAAGGPLISRIRTALEAYAQSILDCP